MHSCAPTADLDPGQSSADSTLKDAEPALPLQEPDAAMSEGSSGEQMKLELMKILTKIHQEVEYCGVKLNFLERRVMKDNFDPLDHDRLKRQLLDALEDRHTRT